MRRIVAIACVTVICATSAALAQTPVISGGGGTFASGQNFVLQGSGFGQKSSPAPVKYDAFESGSVGSQLSGWDFDTGGGTQNPEYSNTWVRPNSTRSAVSIFENGQYLSSFGVYRPAGFATVYMDFWVLFDRPNPVSRNHKLYRLYAGVNGGLPNQYLQLYCNSNNPEGHFTSDGVSGGGWSDTREYPGWGGDSAQHNWVHVQIYLEQSDPGVMNGILKSWFDCGNRVNRSDYLTRDTVNTSDWHSLWFGNYNGHESDQYCAASGDSHIYFDNVYIDVTQARVEVGNNANYDSCTHREIQVPVSWSDGEVQVTANPGSFNPGEQVWFFVVNDSGAVSSGRGPYLVDGTVVEGPGQPGQPTKVN